MITHGLRTPRILIVENDFLIGEMIHDMVGDLGYVVTKVAHRMSSALRELSKEDFDAALVNIGIDDQKHGIDIGDILIAKGIPFGFVSGYSHPQEERQRHIPLLQKPFTEEQLRNFLQAVIGPGVDPAQSPDRAA